MENSFETNGNGHFADRQNTRDLRVHPDVSGDASADLSGIFEREDSIGGLKVLKQGHDGDSRLELRVEPKEGAKLKKSTPNGGRWRKLATRRVLLLALLLLVVAAIAPSVSTYLQSYQSTDDAQIDGHIDPLCSRIDGTVVAVHVEDDDRVTKGELLVEIDPRDYEVAVDNARANLAQAEAQVESAKADHATALSRIVEAQATRSKSVRDVPRYQALQNEGAVARVEYEEIFRVDQVAAATVAANRAAAVSAQKIIGSRQASVKAAQAALDQALLNLSYTKIYAPANGIVGKRAVQLGSRIQPGQTLMFITETDDVWITANFKETQLARMHRGEPVTIRVDTFGRDYQGYVENMPGASGDRFSLLPPENATGNYVKVVQRLPVRIKLSSGQDPEHLLHPGMSVEPKVWLR
jgi:membrane fusion protein (multidrug efflux system)